MDNYEYMYVTKVLEIMKDAKCALSDDEFKKFMESVSKLTKEEIRV